MNTFPRPSVLVLAVAVLLPSTALWGQNPVPNSPPSIAPRNPPLQQAASAAGRDGGSRTGTGTDTTVTPTSAVAAPVTGNAAPPAAVSVSGDYVLSPADTLSMSVFNEPSLTTETRISADGTVQFPLIGEIRLGGMPIRDARELIRRRYNADYLVEPQVYLNVLGYHQSRFTVLGQVNRPGTYDFPPGGEHLGLLEAIGMAGSFTRLADEKNLLIKRGNQTIKINAKKLTTGDNKPFDLAAGDVITVKESIF